MRHQSNQTQTSQHHGVGLGFGNRGQRGNPFKMKGSTRTIPARLYGKGVEVIYIVVENVRPVGRLEIMAGINHGHGRHERSSIGASGECRITGRIFSHQP